MTTHDRTALRAAVLIHAQLVGHSIPDLSRGPSEYSWATAARLRQKIVRANDHGWHLAAGRLHTELVSTLRRCQRELETALRAIEPAVPPLSTPTSPEIYQDLLALGKEFDEVAIDLTGHEICVTTDSIVLEGIELGRFKICLDWHHLGSAPAYRVMALDPNPAGANEEVTHPHVQDETLCEGEGRTSIQAALAQGRLYDLFLLVSQLLHTYGRGSAFVELSAWDGITCDDCGTQVREADRYSCARCENTLCDECSQCCAGCQESHCCGCLSTCPECEREFCRSCLEKCPRCGTKTCEQCRADDLCLTCHQEQCQEEQEHEAEQTTCESEPTTITEPVASAEPCGLGQTVVSA